jgi:hypothetical protein
VIVYVALVAGGVSPCFLTAKVLQGCGHSHYVRSGTAMGLAGLRAAQRRPAAVAVNPANRKAATAALRTAAMTCGAVPDGSRWGSSFMVTLRTWCSASMSQWLRAAAAMTSGWRRTGWCGW